MTRKNFNHIMLIVIGIILFLVAMNNIVKGLNQYVLAGACIFGGLMFYFFGLSAYFKKEKGEKNDKD